MRLVGSILYDADDFIIQFVSSRIPSMAGQSFGPCRAVGIVRGDTLLGGIVWHNFRGFSIDVSIAFDRADWARPSTLRNIFAYPFFQLNVVRITALVGRKNKKMRKFSEGVGFKLEGVARAGYDGKQDAIIYGMLKSDCRFLPKISNDGISING